MISDSIREEIRKHIAQYSGGRELGIRRQDTSECGSAAIGDALEHSGEYLDDELVGELDGTCVVHAYLDNAIDLMARYFGDTIVLVEGRRAGDGIDEGEILIDGAEVIAVWSVER